MLPSRFSEMLSIPVLKDWAEKLWKAGAEQELIGELMTGGDCPTGFWVQLTETGLGRNYVQAIGGGSNRDFYKPMKFL